jgi:HEPN domain-containing protein
MAYTAKDGYTIEDLLHFGFGHVDAARALFKDDPVFLDSAGYLAHLGVELVLKAWHLAWFGQFDKTHDLIELFDALRKKDASLDIGADNEGFLNELDKFYLLRYPRRKDGAVEVGSDQLESLGALLDALWKVMPKELVETYEKIDPTKKGGRILMKKKIETQGRPTTLSRGRAVICSPLTVNVRVREILGRRSWIRRTLSNASIPRRSASTICARLTGGIYWEPMRGNDNSSCRSSSFIWSERSMCWLSASTMLESLVSILRMSVSPQ